jgi:hypothetical protein
MRRGTACLVLVNCLLAGTADAGVSCDLTSHSVSGSSAPTVAHYFVERGVVRVGAADAPRVLLFKDGTIYIIDNPSKSVHVLRNATLAGLQQGRADGSAASPQFAAEPYGRSTSRA